MILVEQHGHIFLALNLIFLLSLNLSIIWSKGNSIQKKKIRTDNAFELDSGKV